MSPRWSPDGERIAFVRVFGDRLTQLWVTDSSLRSPRPLNDVDSVRWARPPITGRTAPVAPDAPAWSPDGRRIAVSRGERIPFERGRLIGGTGLWAYDVDSGRGEPIATHPAGYDGDLQFYRAPAWSPDGKRIAYLGEGVYGYASVIVHTLGATRPDEQSPPVDMLDDYGWPAWSPDGKWLAFRHSLFQSEFALPIETVRLIAPGTSRSRTIYVKSPQPNEFWRVSHLSWSTDGRGLAARLYSSGQPQSGRLAVMAPENGVRLPVIDGLETRGMLSAPFGRLVRVVPVESGVRLLEANGRTVTALPSDDFDISPDGARIVFTISRKGESVEKPALQVLNLR